MLRIFTVLAAQLLTSFLLAAAADAEVFKYVDGEGRTHYVTDASKVPTEFQAQVDSPHELPRINKVKSLSGPLPVRRLKSSSPSAGGKVEIFVTSWCPYCVKLEKFLKAKRIKFTRYDIERSKVGSKKYSEMGVQGVPIVRIGSTVISGFNEAAILSALNK